ncbi:MAG: cardiolipin synthase [Lachnospiraceae bacterium]|jgi:cardiolipin synthase|nr:cardiolipin synthase [Lachnospiraceae bacterium]MCI9133270.1 cardiolipin synthase [Lachnospiraceae bacterium]
MLPAIWNGLVEILKFWMDHLLFINILLSIMIVFFERREPRSVWTWLLLLYFVPIVGIFLYFMIGHDFHREHMFRTKEIEDAIHSAIRTQEETIRTDRFHPTDPRLRKFSDLVLFNLEASDSVYTADNHVEIFTDGKKKFQALYEEILRAKKYIHIQYYIIRDDELWRSLEKALIQKARSGVEVRILYDSMGCRTMLKRRWKRLAAEGIQIGEFFPAVLRRLQLRINYRNHRKIVVIDGRTAFVGGFNVGREYLGLDEKFGYWRDTHLKIQGSAVLALHIRFILDWNYATKQNLFTQDEYFQEEDKRKAGREAVQIISSGPDAKEQNIRDTYLKMISKARKNIYIQTPYFIPDESVLDAIRIAAMSGVDVRLMIPCKPDHPFVYWATYSYVGDLLEAGAKCYTYNNGFLHAKGMTVDGVVSCYGTANMDIRSFKLNFEVNAVIYSAKVTEELDRRFREDLKYCTHITPYIYGQRSWMVRVKEQFSRLLSPLL